MITKTAASLTREGHSREAAEYAALRKYLQNLERSSQEYTDRAPVRARLTRESRIPKRARQVASAAHRRELKHSRGKNDYVPMLIPSSEKSLAKQRAKTESATKTASVLGTNVRREMEAMGNLDDANAMKQYRSLLYQKSLEDRTKAKDAGVGGGLIGGGLGLAGSTKFPGWKSKLIGATAGAATGAGAGLLAKLMDDGAIEEAEEKKKAPNSELLRDVAESRRSTRMSDQHRQARLNAFYANR